MPDKHTTIILTGDHIQKIILHTGINKIMDQIIEDTYLAFINFDVEDNMMTKRSGFNYTDPYEGLVEWMPIRSVKEYEVTIKVVGYHPKNPEHFQLPTILSSISKYDSQTGHLKALIDGVLPTSLRTGAASAVASKLFGYDQSESLGLVGCGAQSITQLHAISRIFDIKKVYYYDVDQLTQNSFESRVSMLGLNCEFISSDINEVLSKCDIVCTATSIGVGEGPLFENIEIKDWLHINAIGSDFPGKFELPLELLKKSYVCPDWVDQAVIEGECQQLKESQIGQSLSYCLKKANQLKHLNNSLTVFDSTGIALQDMVVSKIFLDYATELNLGHKINIESWSEDEKNPYSFLKSLKTT